MPVAGVTEINRNAHQTDGRCVAVNRRILDATTYVLDYTFGADLPAPA